MGFFNRVVARLTRQSRRRLAFRMALAAPFVVSLLLALVLGPETIDNLHASFGWLAVTSLAFATLMVAAGDGLLVLVGLVAVLVFPLLAGLGFYFAPAWARPIVVIVFYGSILASCVAVLFGILIVVRGLLRAHTHALAIGMAVLIVAAAGITVTRAAPRGTANAPASGAVEIVNLGAIINTDQREAEPTFSADGRTMIYNCRNDDICVSRRTGSSQDVPWSAPEALPPPINGPFIDIEPWLSPAGDKLYINSNRPFATGEGLPGLALYVDVVGRISGELGITPLGGVGQNQVWVSHLRNGVWSQPVDLDDAPGEPPVNTAYKDHCIAFSADGSEVFWTSTRPGGHGGNDIWTSRRVNGSWTEPENLGSTVNGLGDEHHSIPSPDGRSLHVTSGRPGGYGGDDLYVASRRPDGTWGRLVNLGPAINGPGNDRCAAWTPDGSTFLFDSDRPGGRGGKDLWRVHMADVVPPTERGGQQSEQLVVQAAARAGLAERQQL